jgi:uroporphyrinogen-III decarboxylase
MSVYIKSVLEEIAPGDRVLLGSGDATPIGTPLENLKAITETVARYGRYPLRF